MTTATLAPPLARPTQDAQRTPTVLITGCNTGIGKELALQTLASSARLLFTCRTAEKVAATAADLCAAFPQAEVCGYRLDLSDQQSVDELCDRLQRERVEIDSLILNAGVHVPFAHRMTVDGHELHHQVNFLSPARLFLRLAGLGAPPRRVLYVSSNAHQRGQIPVIFPFSFWARYARSKLLATTFFLSARPLYAGTTISVVSPGSVATDVHRHKHPIVRALGRITGRGQAATKAAADLLEAAFRSADPEAYRNRGEVTPVSPSCSDASLQLRVWKEATADLPAGERHRVPIHVIGNHAGTLSMLAPPVQTPRTETEVADIVRRAGHSGRKIRVVGSRHSYNDCFYSPSELISLERFRTIGEIDEQQNTITIGAGVTVQELCDHLDRCGYALRWAGNSGEQTVVGAATTGTHGYCRDGGLLAELIVGLRVVTGTGEILAMQDEEELRALRVSLGTLGIVTTVTLSLERKGALVRYSLETLDEDAFLSRLCRDGRTNEYFRFFPNRYHRDRFSVLTINPTSESPRAEDLGRVRYIDKTNAPRLLVAVLRGLMRSALAHRVLRRLPAPRLRMSLVAPFSTLLFVNCGIVDRWYRLAGLVYQAWNDDRTRNMELAVRPQDFATFLKVLRRVEARFQGRTGVAEPYFTGRYVGASDRTLLGPNRGRDVVFIDIHVQKCPMAPVFLRALEMSLMGVIPVRPHWGKEFAQGLRDITRAYPTDVWREFRAAKKRYDPDNLFSNAYTMRVFGW
jgi:L-gulonolactone oxidase